MGRRWNRWRVTGRSGSEPRLAEGYAARASIPAARPPGPERQRLPRPRAIRRLDAAARLALRRLHDGCHRGRLASRERGRRAGAPPVMVEAPAERGEFSPMGTLPPQRQPDVPDYAAMTRPQGLSNPQSIRGIVFDLDGTLVDSYEAIGDSLNHALAGLGRGPRGMDWVGEMVGRGLEVLIEAALGAGEGAGASASPEAIAEGVRLFRARYDEICVARTSLMPGVAGTLRSLRGRGYRMAVATNKPSYFASRLLDALEVGDCLDAVLGPDLV